MAVFLITYDLNSPGQQHNKIDLALKNVGAFRIMESCWLVESQKPLFADAIRNVLMQHLVDLNDILFVTRIHSCDWALWNIHPEAGVWLQDPRRIW